MSRFHPVSGFHYVHVIPDSWGPFVDIHFLYSNFSSKNEWISVISCKDFEMIRDQGNAYLDNRYFFILWDFLIDPGSKDDRKAVVTCVYSEAIGSTLKMLSDHLHVFNRFFQLSKKFDGIFCHTPWMASKLSDLVSVKSFVLPVGWDPNSCGRPRFDSPKHNDFVFYGSDVGKRRFFVPFLKSYFGSKFENISGSYGRGLLGQLDTSKASLYLAHSSVESFSTWRTWQMIGSSAALIAERSDTWPMVQGTHYIEIPQITIENIDSVCVELGRILREADLLSYAIRLYDDLGPIFTIEECINSYLVPSSIVLKELVS